MIIAYKNNRVANSIGIHRRSSSFSFSESERQQVSTNFPFYQIHIVIVTVKTNSPIAKAPEVFLDCVSIRAIWPSGGLVRGVLMNPTKQFPYYYLNSLRQHRSVFR